MIRSSSLHTNLRNIKPGDQMQALMTWMKKQTKKTYISASSGRLGFLFRVNENNRGVCQSLDFAEKCTDDSTGDFGMYMIAQNNAAWEPGETNKTNPVLEDLAGTFMNLIEKGQFKVLY